MTQPVYTGRINLRLMPIDTIMINIKNESTNNSNEDNDQIICTHDSAEKSLEKVRYQSSKDRVNNEDEEDEEDDSMFGNLFYCKGYN